MQVFQALQQLVGSSFYACFVAHETMLPPSPGNPLYKANS